MHLFLEEAEKSTHIAASEPAGNRALLFCLDKVCVARETGVFLSSPSSIRQADQWDVPSDALGKRACFSFRKEPRVEANGSSRVSRVNVCDNALLTEGPAASRILECPHSGSARTQR